MGLVALSFLPDRPQMTSFFDDVERKLGFERVNRAISADVGYVVKKGLLVIFSPVWKVVYSEILP